MMLLPVLSSIPSVPSAAPCRVGCTACCHGPFDISPSEAKLVHAAVAALSPTVREGVRDRVGAQLEAMRARLPGWGAPWDVAALDEATFDDLVAEFAAVPCPALDPASGACLIHESRPSTCRLMGMSVVTVDGGVLENACPIQDEFPGYAELPPVAFDLEAMEQALEEQDAAAHAEGWVMTTIAGAILTGHPEQREGSR